MSKKDILNTNINEDIIPDSFKKAGGKGHSSTRKTDYSISKDKDLFGKDLQAFKEETGTEGFVLSPTELQKGQEDFGRAIQRNITRAEDIEAYTQSTADKIGNGLVKFGGRVFTSVAGSTVGTLYGLMAWARDGEFKSFYDNEFQDGLDGINDYLAENFKHHYTSDPNDWEIGNFWFDKVFDGLGFATGAVISGMTGAGIVGKLGRGIKFTKALKAGAVKELKELGAKNASKKVLRDASYKVSKLDKIGKNLSQIPQTVTSTVTGAAYESGVEARHAFDTIVDELREEYKRERGVQFVPEKDMEEIIKLAGKSANGIFAANMALVGSGNFLQFGRHLGMDFPTMSRLFGKQSIAKVLDKRASAEATKKFKDQISKEYTKKGSSLLRGVAKITKNPLVESQEEMLQSVISGTGEEYALKKYKNNDSDILDLVDAVIKSARKTYSSAEGWEEGLIGAIIGGAGVVGPKRKESGKYGIGIMGGVAESISEYKADEANRDKIVDIVNNNDATSTLKSSFGHAVRAKELSKIQDKAVAENKRKEYEDAKNEGLFSYVEARKEAGMLTSVYEDLNEMRQAPIEEFKEAFGIPNEVEYTEEQKIKEINSLERQITEIDNNFKFIENLYPNASQDIQTALSYNKYKFDRNESRKESLAKEIDELTGYHFTTNQIPLNQLDSEGKRLSKKEVFKNVPYAKKTFNHKVYEALYDDYVELEKEQEILSKEWNAYNNPEEQLKIDQAVAKEKRKEAAAIAKELEKRAVAAEQEKKEQSQKKRTENKQTAKNTVKSIEELIDNSTRLNLEEPNAEAPAIIPEEQVAEVVKNINAIEGSNPSNLTNFFKSLTDLTELDSLNNLPVPIKEAINNKLDELQKESEVLKALLQDPKGINPETPKTQDIIDEGLEALNQEAETSVAPKEVNSEEIKEELSKSNDGQSVNSVGGKSIQKESKGIYRVGKKLVDAFNAVAVSTRAFVEGRTSIEDVDDTITTETSTSVLSEKKLLPGESVTIRRFEADTMTLANGETLENPYDENQILEVVYEDEVVGYIHDLDYITPNRVVEGQIGENIPDNIERNKEGLVALRKEIFDAIGTEVGKTTTLKISSKSAGTIMTKANKKFDESLTDAFENDSRPEILVVSNTDIKLGTQSLSDSHLADKLVFNFDEYESEDGETFYEKFSGSTLVAVPGANGKYILSFAKNNTLADSKIDDIPVVDIVHEVLEAYVLEDTETLDAYGIENTAESVKRYVNNFMYTTGTSTSPHYMYIGYSEKTSERVVNYIVGESNPQKVQYNKGAIEKEKKGIPGSFEKALRSKLLTVSLDHLSDTVIGKKRLAKKINIKSKEITYRDFIKDNLFVDFTGNNIEVNNKTERVYVANPIITLETSGTFKNELTPKVSKKVQPTDTESPFTEEEFEAGKEGTTTDVKADIERRREGKIKYSFKSDLGKSLKEIPNITEKELAAILSYAENLDRTTHKDSTLRNLDGTLKIMFHGSKRKFKSFSSGVALNTTEDIEGYYFSDFYETASDYAYLLFNDDRLSTESEVKNGIIYSQARRLGLIDSNNNISKRNIEKIADSIKKQKDKSFFEGDIYSTSGTKEQIINSITKKITKSLEIGKIINDKNYSPNVSIAFINSKESKTAAFKSHEFDKKAAYKKQNEDLLIVKGDNKLTEYIVFDNSNIAKYDADLVALEGTTTDLEAKKALLNEYIKEDQAAIKKIEDKLSGNKEAITKLYEKLKSLPEKSNEKKEVLEEIETLERKKPSRTEITELKNSLKFRKERLERAKKELAALEQQQGGEVKSKEAEINKLQSKELQNEIDSKYQPQYADALNIDKNDKVTYDIDKIISVIQSMVDEYYLPVKNITQVKSSFKVKIEFENGDSMVFGSILAGALGGGLTKEERVDRLAAIWKEVIDNHGSDWATNVNRELKNKYESKPKKIKSTSKLLKHGKKGSRKNGKKRLSPSRWVTEDIREGTGAILDSNGNVLASKESDDIASSLMTVMYNIIKESKDSPRVSQVIADLKGELEMLKDIYSSYAEKEIIVEEDRNEAPEDFEVLDTPEDNARMAENYQLVLDNFDQFINLAIQKLEERNFKVTTGTDTKSEEISQEDILDQGINDVLEEGSTDNVKTDFDEGSVFRQDPIKGLSAKVRIMLSEIYDDGVNMLGLDTYYDFYDIYTTLLDIYSDNVEKTFEELVEELKLHTERKPYLSEVIEILESDEYLTQQDKNIFHSNLRKVYAKFETVIAKDNSIKPIEANRNTLERTIAKDWLTNTAQANIFTTKNGQVVVDEDFRDNKLEDLWDAIKNSEYSVEAVQTFLDAVGIRMSTEALTYLKNESSNLKEFGKTNWPVLFGNTSSAGFTVIKDSFKGEVEPDVHPIQDEGYVKKLAAIEALFREDTNVDSLVNAEGNTIFSYISPSWIVNRFLQLKDSKGVVQKNFVKSLLNIPALSWSTHLHKLLTDDRFASNYGLSILDTLKVNKNQAKKFSSLSAAEQTVAQVNLFVNGMQGTESNRIGKFVVAKSDKHVLHILSATKHNLDRTNTNPAQGTFGEVDKQALLNIVRGEVTRIEDAQQKQEAGINFLDISGYDPFIFYNFPQLNYLKENGDVNEIAAPLYYPDGTLKKVDETSESLMWDIIKDVILTEIENTKNDLIDKKIIQDGVLSKVDSSYVQTFSGDVDLFVADFVINTMIATNEYNMIYQGDLAAAAKKKDGKTSVSKTVANMFKRLAKDIAPGVRGAKYENDPYNYNTYKQIFLADAVSSSNALEELIEMYGEESSVIKAYSELEGTDAQEVTTLAEHLKVMFHHGRISDEHFNMLITKAENGKEYTAEELKVLKEVALQPMKPVYVGMQRMDQYGAEIPVYIKTSSFPLVPQLVKGTQWAKLEKAMRLNDISRATFSTGAKLGAYKTIDAWEKIQNEKGENTDLTNGILDNKIITKAIAEGSFLELNRDNFGIQQDVPFDSEKKKILEGSQLMKLILPGIIGNDQVSKQELIQEFHNLHIDMTENAFQDFLDEIGFEEQEDGAITFSNVEKLRDMLLAELTARGGYTANDLKSLEVDPTDSFKFKIPIWATAKSKKYEALLNSIITKRILRQKMPGKSYVLGTEEGWLGASPAITKIKNGLKGTEYNSKEGLKPQRKGYVSTVDGSKIEASEYKQLSKTEKKYYNETVFPAQVLIARGKFNDKQMVGYRIPTQGLNSMSAMEVVGYLPDYMADLLIAPKDFVVQMGSDFDIDKLYVHRWHETKKGKRVSNVTIDEAWEFYLDTREKQEFEAKKEIKLTAQVTNYLNKLVEKSTGDSDFVTLTEEEVEQIYNKVVTNTLTKEGFEQLFTKKISQNRIMDMYWDTLTHLDNLKRVLKPLDFGNLETAVEKVRSKTEQVATPHILSPVHQINNYQNGNAGKFGVGVTSIASTTKALFNTALDSINIPGDYKFLVNDSEGKDKLVEVTSLSNTKVLDENTDMLIEDVISAFQSASVDNIKELIIKDINYNSYTHDAFTALAFLGLSDEYISYFLAQPIIKEYVQEMELSRDAFDGSYVNKADVINEIIRKKTQDITDEELLDQIDESIEEYNKPYSADQLLDEIEKNDLVAQINLLSKFSALSSTGSEINSVARALQPSTSGIGQDRLSSKMKYDLAESVILESPLSGVQSLFGNVKMKEVDGQKVPDRDVNNNIQLDATTVAGKGINILTRANNAFNQFFKINRLGEQVTDALARNRREGSFTFKEMSKMINFTKSYIFSSELGIYLGEDPNELRERLLYGDETLASRWAKFKAENPTNYLAKRIQVEESKSKVKPSTISYQASLADRPGDSNNTNELVAMLYSEDPEVQKLAQDTIAYTYIRGGNQDAFSLLKFIPSKYLMVNNFGESVDNALDGFLGAKNREFDNSIIVEQYLQHNPYHAFQIPLLVDPIETEVTEEVLKIKAKQSIVNPRQTKYISKQVNKEWRLYRYKGVDKESSDLVYERMDLLGTSKFLEPQFEVRNATSTIAANKAIAEVEEVVEVLDSKPEPMGVTGSTKNVFKSNYTGKKYMPSTKDATNQVLARVANKYSVESSREMARTLIPFVQNVPIEIVDTKKEFGVSADGVYKDGKIYMDSTITDESTFVRVLLHEATHAILADVIDNPTSPEQIAAKDKLNALFTAVKEKYTGSNKNATKDLHEFVSELMSDVEFQKELDAIPFNESDSIWQSIIKMFTDLINSITQKGVATTAIEEVMTLIESVDLQTTQISKESINVINDAINSTIGEELPEGVTIQDLYREYLDNTTIDEDLPDDLKQSPKRSKVSSLFTDGVTNSSTVLNDIANSDHNLNKLAKKLIPFVNKNNVSLELVKETITHPINGTKHDGMYYGNKILISEGADITTILHEILHSISHKILVENPNPQFEAMFTKAQEELGTSYYALSSIDEFLVGLFTDAKFINAVKDLDPIAAKTDKNLFQEIFDHILSLLNIAESNNLYEQAFATATNLLEEQRILTENTALERDQYEQMMQDVFKNDIFVEMTDSELEDLIKKCK